MRHFWYSLTLLLFTTTVLNAQTVFTAHLSGHNEATPIASSASGAITATLTGMELVVTGSFSGLEGEYDATIAGGSHVHLGLAGQNGDVALFLAPVLDDDLKSGTYGEVLNTFMLDADQMAALMNRNLYINIHTTAYPGGELRGQLLPEADEYYTATLFGSNEVPAVMSAASGALNLELFGDQLTVTGAFSGLEGDFDASIAGGAHLHIAGAGANGDVTVLLNATPDDDLKGGVFEAMNNTFTIDADQIAALQARKFYANIHTTAVASGELRGQVVGQATTLFRAHLSGSNELPVVTSTATGVVLAELNGDQLTVSGSFAGLESDVAVDIAGGAHLHLGMAGQTGDVAHLLTSTLDGDMRGGTFEAADNTFTLTAEQIDALYNRGIYINIHSIDNQAGELRGQLLPESQSVFTGFLSGIFEVPAVTTTAQGGVKAELTGNTLVVSGAFSGMSSAVDENIAGGSHIHLGVPGATGGVEFILMGTYDMDGLGGVFAAADNTFDLTDEQVANLKARMNYVNIHTLNEQGGELRAQLMHEATTYMVAPLSGTSETDLVNTTAGGMTIIEVSGGNGIAVGGFLGLESDFDVNVAGGAHIHNAFAGSAGPVAAFLNADLDEDLRGGIFAAANNVFELSAGQLDTMRQGMSYVNLHSVDNPAGVIRGQILPLATAYFTTTLSGIVEIPNIVTAAAGAAKLVLNGDQLSMSGSFSGLEGDFDASIAGGSHIHVGSVSNTGDVSIIINASVRDDLKSGTYAYADNTFTVDATQMDALLNDNFYVNIHTTTHQSGELRGQILAEPNHFPTGGLEITSPADGAEITISGTTTDVFTVEWSASTDRDPLGYLWEVSADPTFSSPILLENTGADNSISLDLTLIDDLLESFGIPVGGSATLYHRAYATDGSLTLTGGAASVIITRGFVGDNLYQAVLSGHNEVLPIATSAAGLLTASLEGDQLTITGSFSGLADTVATAIAGGAHVHIGYAGQAGDVALVLNATLDADGLGGTFEAANNTFTLTAEQSAALLDRQMYVNIHSGAFLSGELRGQILPIADETYSLSLLGSNEVPSVISGGHGALILEVQGDQLTVTGSFADLDGDFDASIAGGAHLHLGLAGQTGDATIILNTTVSDDLRSGVYEAANNTFTLTADQSTALKARNIYANIHTTAVASGELRGQVAAQPNTVFRAHLSGANELPVVTTGAGGQVTAELSGNTLTVSGAFAGLEGDIATDIAGGAHVHLGMAGATGDVALILTITADDDNRGGIFAAVDNTFELTNEQVAAIYERGMYINIHSAAHLAGELRGQLIPESQAVLNGFLSGIFGVPEVASGGQGGLKAELSGNVLTVSGAFAGLGSAVDVNIAGGAHIHTGLAGATGDVAFVLNASLTEDGTGGVFAAADNSFELTDEQVADLIARKHYVNIHTVNEQAGEVRAQLLPEATAYFPVPLSGASEVPAVNTGASGMTIVEVTGNNAVMTGAFSGLESNFDASIAGGAHIHNGLAGSAGGVAFLINADVAADLRSGAFEAANNAFELTDGQLDTLRQRMNYVNIHTVDNGGGELRGQILPLATTYLTTTLTGLTEVPPVQTNAYGDLKFELNGDQLTVSGSFSGLEGDFDASIAGGAHLHIGKPGDNGDVSVLLNTTVSDDLRSGVYTAAENTFTLDADQMAAVRAGDFYTNIHTMAFASGELRGQVLPEINRFPEGSLMITSPANGAAITIEGSPSDLFTVEWTPATDRNLVVYGWELAATPDFSISVFGANTGTTPAFTADLESLDALLAGAGIPVGGSITLFHRASASDGSLTITGNASTVVVTRGVVAETLLTSTLSGHNEVFPVVTPASGTINAVLAGSELRVSGSFGGLRGPVATDIAGGAHLHLGYAGQNGDVMFLLNATLDADSLGGTFEEANNTFELTNEQINQILGRRVYVNIHSAAVPSGELRGQIIPVSDAAYSMNLFGSNEVPVVLSSGHGALVLDVLGDELVVTGSFANLDGDFDASIAGGAHLHLGMAGMNGDVSIPLVATTDADLKSGVFTAVSNTFPITQEQKEALEGRRIYANIHTTTTPSGELRGQVSALPQTVFRAHLSGSNGVPVVMSRAQGQIQAELVNDSMLVVSGSFSGLESDLATDIAGGVHIHTAPAGRTGDVILVLTPTMGDDNRSASFSPVENTFPLTPDQRLMLYRRGFYINVHSIDNQPGEIRGQLLPESQAVFTGFLSGIYTVPSISTRALGAVKAELNGNSLTVSGSFNNLSSPLATDIAGGVHIHQGMAGQTGDVDFVLTSLPIPSPTGGLFPAGPNTFTLSDDQLARLKARGYYINIHSEDNQSGELRTQLVHEANMHFVAPLGGVGHILNTPANGMAVAEINGNTAYISGSFQGLTSDVNEEIAGGSHVHLGLAGQTGDVLAVLNTTLDSDNRGGRYAVADNVFDLTDEDIQVVRQRANYVNIHTMDFAGGEIRGQFLPLATSYFQASLQGLNEVQPEISAGRGSMVVEVSGDRMVATGSFSDLIGDFDANIAGGVHLHLGGVGTNGDVAIGLNATVDTDLKGGTFSAMDNGFMLSEDEQGALRAGDTYVNIHTTQVASGEIRAQVLPAINFYPSAEATITAPEDGATVVIEGDPTTAFTATWNEATDRDALAYIWQLSITPEFNSLLVNQNVGDAQAFMTDFGTVDAMLEVAGVNVGEDVTLYHRAIASDGSLFTPGEASSVTLTRGMLVGTTNPLLENFNFKLYPTLTKANSMVNIEVTVGDNAQGELVVLNQLGQQLSVQPVELFIGENFYQLPIADLAAGSYFVQLRVDGVLVPVQAIVVGE